MAKKIARKYPPYVKAYMTPEMFANVERHRKSVSAMFSLSQAAAALIEIGLRHRNCGSSELPLK